MQGIYKQFSLRIDAEQNRIIHAFTEKLREDLLYGISDIIPSYCNLYIEFDAEKCSRQKVANWLEQKQASLKPNTKQRTVTIPVDYNGQDLEYLSLKSGLSKKEIIALHSANKYQVYAMGFSPGFPFMAELDKAIQFPRRGVPRLEVPAGSVAIANAQTGIYPLKSPGGWHILGQALKTIYDPNRKKPFLLKPGDLVKFEPAKARRLPEVQTLELIPEPEYPLFRVLEPGLLDIFVDKGRFLAAHYGLSRSGPIDAKLANLANRLVANKKDQVVLEMHVTGPALEVLNDILVSFVGYSLQMLVDGVAQDAFETLLLKKGSIVSFKPLQSAGPSYFAINGGFDSNKFMASASVDLRAKIGRALRVDDVLSGSGVGWARAKRSFKPYYKRLSTVTLRLIKGPQYDAKVAKELSQNEFTVAHKDRVGIRFAGAKIFGFGIVSEAVPLGALQITNDGMPILLLNDRGTIGGYSKPALLHPDYFSKAAQLAVGNKVRFIF